MLRNALFMYLGVGCLLDAHLILKGTYEDYSDDLIKNYGMGLKSRLILCITHLATIVVSPIFIIYGIIDAIKEIKSGYESK